MAKVIKPIPKKIFSFEIFELDIKTEDEEKTKFEHFLQNILADHIPVYHDGNPIYLESFKKTGNFFYGTLTSSQMQEIPNVFDNVKKKSIKWDLEENQGLAHPTSFLYDIELSMLIYEAGKNGVLLNSFCEFFEKNYNIPYINTKIVVEPSEIEKLNKMVYIKSFQLKIAKIKNGRLFKTKEKKAVSEVMDLAKDTNSTVMECKMFSGRKKKNSLNVPIIKGMVNELLNYRDNKEVPILIISGRETEDDTTNILNFIANRIVLKFGLEKQRFSNMNLQPKYDLLEQKYKEIRQGLLLAYKEQK